MKMFRCTRPGKYDHLEEPWRSGLSNRQGHYVEACCEEGAYEKMRADFPDEKPKASSSPFFFWR